MIEEFVIRPGRSFIGWTKASSKGAEFRILSEVAVSVYCEDEHGAVTSWPPRCEHHINVSLDTPRRLKLRLQNSSGTRKARGTIEVIRG